MSPRYALLVPVPLLHDAGDSRVRQIDLVGQPRAGVPDGRRQRLAEHGELQPELGAELVLNVCGQVPPLAAKAGMWTVVPGKPDRHDGLCPGETLQIRPAQHAAQPQ